MVLHFMMTCEKYFVLSIELIYDACIDKQRTNLELSTTSTCSRNALLSENSNGSGVVSIITEKHNGVMTYISKVAVVMYI